MAKRRTSSTTKKTVNARREAKRTSASKRPVASKAKKAAPAKKSTRAAKTRTAKQASKTPRRKAAVAASTPDVLDLKSLRRDIERAVSALARRGGAAGERSSTIAGVQASMSRWVSEIDSICEPGAEEICGPTMLMPLA